MIKEVIAGAGFLAAGAFSSSTLCETLASDSYLFEDLYTRVMGSNESTCIRPEYSRSLCVFSLTGKNGINQSAILDYFAAADLEDGSRLLVVGNYTSANKSYRITLHIVRDGESFGLENVALFQVGHGTPLEFQGIWNQKVNALTSARKSALDDKVLALSIAISGIRGAEAEYTQFVRHVVGVLEDTYGHR